MMKSLKIAAAVKQFKRNNINKTQEKQLEQTTFDKVSFCGNKQNTIQKCNEPNVGETSLISVSQRHKSHPRGEINVCCSDGQTVVADRNTTYLF